MLKNLVVPIRNNQKSGSSRSVHMITVSNHERSLDARGALVDRGASGGIAGADTRLIRASGRHVDVTGIDNHKIKNLAIGTCGGVFDTDQGKVNVDRVEHMLMSVGMNCLMKRIVLFASSFARRRGLHATSDAPLQCMVQFANQDLLHPKHV